MILELDIGNSRLKWRLVQVGSSPYLEGADVSSGVVSHGGSFAFSLPFDGSVTEVWISSVLAGRVNQIAEWCVKEYGVAAQFARTSRSLLGVSNSYTNVEHMGVDRWLAIVAAHNALGEAIVVDCGSACTIDIVLANGCHQGGYILPGFTLMKTHLLSKMRRVVEPSPLPLSTVPGCSTIDALDAGLLLMLVGAIEQVQRRFVSVQWVFTGGDGRWLMDHVLASLGASAVYRPDLVLDGLSLFRGGDGCVVG